MKVNSTVLEKLGINREIIEFLKSKGLKVPKKVKPVEKPLRSPSEEWFYSIADRFTPKLSETEMEVFKKFPYLFSQKVIKAIELERDVSTILYTALEKVKTNLKSKEEQIAAVLSILRIFHACLDNTLKYDRHLEYHEYEKESPVGYIWNKFKKLISKSAQNAKVRNAEEWANQKLLEIISGHRRLFFTTEYILCCKDIYEMLKKKIPEIDSLSPEKIIEKLKAEFPELFEIIRECSEGFYRLPEEFIRDCIESKHINPFEKITKNKRISEKALKTVCSNLSEKEASEFERLVEIIEEFLAAQEIVGAIGSGAYPNTKNKVLDILIAGYDLLQELLADGSFIKKEKKETVLQLLNAKDVPSKFIALREFMSKGEEFLDEKIRKLYLEEIERW